MKKRRQRVLIDLLSEKGYSNIRELAKALNVSEMTVRRDVRSLENDGVVELHGGVVLLKKIKNYSSRKIRNVREKEKIAEIAAEFFENKKFIYLDGCTTNLVFAKKLSGMSFDNSIRVITNDPHIIIELGKVQKISIFVLPGLYDSANETVIPHDVNDLKKYIEGIEIAFLGITGISSDGHFYNADPFEAAFKKEIIKIAREVIIVADHTKFNRKFPWEVCSFEEVDYLITDQVPDEKFIWLAKENGLQILYPIRNLNPLMEAGE